MLYTYASFCNIGTRANNEDAINVLQQENDLIAIVADGVGGLANGEVASAMAAEVIPPSLLGKAFDEDELGYAILDAHDAICKRKCSACTTIAILWIHKDAAIAAHVGDSRIYQFRNGQIVYQSEDHSLVQVAISLGKLPPDAYRNHKDRNKVYRVLGDEKETPKIDLRELEILPGDRFLLCSDGFWEPVTEDAMLTCLDTASTPEAWMNAMVSLLRKANDPKQDNHTAIAIFADL